ncbi:hypothetical protein [Mycobacterium asiaticum]|uniref:hypothetical protein n=1 Tax=Mycobacterium asiaticum TaxID=1790 RepID=UPI000A49D572|nr:hypothetical protein [Mycobacterium asiaticum]
MMRHADIDYLSGLLTARTHTLTAMSALIHTTDSEREGSAHEQRLINGIVEELGRPA